MSEAGSAIDSGGLGPQRTPGSDPSTLKIASEKTKWLDRFNERLSEWCSSILVKETRQALKSRQFIWTYFLLILAVGVWTALGLTFGIRSYQLGRELLTGFWFILGFPLGLIIPFSAYRSLAREYEDGTIQLISITTMKPYQIVIGKFGSAILQMLVYLSILAPCIAFTYMLRGISLEQILLGLAICIGGSICLTILGLFLAGAFRSRTMGVGVSVLFVLLLGWLYYGWCQLCVELTYYSNRMGIWDEPEAVAVTFGVVAFLGSTAALLLVAAAAQISFPSDNRSTVIRLMMLIQQALFVALIVICMPFSISFLDEFCLGMIFFAGHYWLIMGCLMIGESSRISRRVQRTLPRSIFSRSFFSLLMPGSGRGFLFAVANMWACFAILMLIITFARYLVTESALQQFMIRWTGAPTPTLGGPAMPTIGPDWPMVMSSAVSCFFVTWFLSLTYLFMHLVLDKRKKEWTTGVGPTISLLSGGFLLAAVTISSVILHFNMNSPGFRNVTSPYLVVNWYWVTVDLAQVGRSTLSVQAFWFIGFLLVASFTILAAILFASRELRYHAVDLPERVAIDSQRPRNTPVLSGETIEEIFGELKAPGD